MKTKTKTEMTASTFRKWLRQMEYNHAQAARELGVSRGSVIKWTKEGAPKHVRLACAYLSEHPA